MGSARAGRQACIDQLMRRADRVTAVRANDFEHPCSLFLPAAFQWLDERTALGFTSSPFKRPISSGLPGVLVHSALNLALSIFTNATLWLTFGPREINSCAKVRKTTREIVSEKSGVDPLPPDFPRAREHPLSLACSR